MTTGISAAAPGSGAVASRFADLAALAAMVGRPLGVSAWQEIGQARVDSFAAVTGDGQWIHIDPARAARGPYGGPIAHGLLLASLMPGPVVELLAVDGIDLVLNAGLERLTFPAPVLVGERVRVRAELASFTWRVRGAADVTVEACVEVQQRPAVGCSALLRLVLRPRSAPRRRDSRP
ncbi:MaoC family dehydratase [Micromonospora sp. WMMA1363]|uniref:MaoC family dehydratase n=1 Tax=Micromonospora sp. WMMA1363 TaxID=3053985 RepID=UPI00259C8F82|nr:MaoC family dehydratase [Micromonospora sp. WMMA1363]MDM4722826.1 MaoC family dehydratase [Micromonospora sp. WMMA1363]